MLVHSLAAPFRQPSSCASAALDRILTRALALALVLVAAVPAAADVQHDLEGSGAGLFWTSGSGRGTAIALSDPVLRDELDLTCPANVSIRLAAPGVDSGEIALPCANWHAKRDGFVYRSRRSRSGADRVELRRGRLTVRVGPETLPPIRRNSSFVEVRMRVDARSFCARFERLRPGRRLIRARGPTQPCRELRPRPNILVINLDDARFDGVDLMPAVQHRLADEGVRFSNSFTPDSVCAPSRASILSGLYAVNHRVRHVRGSIGGADIFREQGTDQRTIAVWLQDAGYRTGLFGKYLNAYWSKTEGDAGPGGSFYLPPGWDRWWAMISPPHYGGLNGKSYQAIEETGVISDFDDHTSDAQYSTDLSARLLREFVAGSVADGQPFFAYWAPYAPHVEAPPFVAVPAERHFGSLESLVPWRPESWNEPDVSDKPRSLQGQVNLPFIWLTDQMRIRGYEALLAADEQVEATLDLLDELQVSRDTVIVLTSDNGVTWGEHRQFVMEKGCPYEECQRVPMIVRYPRWSAPGTEVDATAVLNIDLAPTLAELADVEIQTPIDGRSFAGWIEGRADARERNDYLVEFWRRDRSSYVDLGRLPMDGDRLRLWYGDSRAQPRASRIFEFDIGDGVSPDAVAVQIMLTAGGTAQGLRGRIWWNVPGVWIGGLGTRVLVEDRSPEQHGVYFWEELDQDGALEPQNDDPDYFGVRDVRGDYLWVEYETGERELYDLRVDPHQLLSVADDPAYAAVRQRLAARLEALLAEARQVGASSEPRQLWSNRGDNHE